MKLLFSENTLYRNCVSEWPLFGLKLSKGIAIQETTFVSNFEHLIVSCWLVGKYFRYVIVEEKRKKVIVFGTENAENVSGFRLWQLNELKELSQ